MQKKTRYILNPTLKAVLSLENRRSGGTKIDLSFPIGKSTATMNTILDAIRHGSNGDFKFDSKWIPFKKELLDCGIVIDSAHVPEEIKPRFALNKSTIDFIPKESQLSAEFEIRTKNLFFNKHNIFFQDQRERPKNTPFGIPPPNDFPSAGKMVWVFNPNLKNWAVYQCDHKLFQSIQHLKYDNTKIRKLPIDTMLLLLHSRVLVSGDRIKKDALMWRQRLQKAKLSIKKDGFATIPDTITPAQIAIARQYFRSLETNGYLLLDKTQVKNGRYETNNDDFSRFLHRQSGNLMRTITNEMIYPSYTYLSAYKEHASLKKHTDRSQCAWNGSLLVDANPDLEDVGPWPIFLECSSGIKKISQQLGDLLVYRGHQTPHWRPKSKKNARQTLVLLHYVPIDFTGSLE